MALRSGFPLCLVAQCALLVAFLAPVAARATSCTSGPTQTCFTNEGGNATSQGTGFNTTFSLTDSPVSSIGWKTSGNLGTFSFATGDLTSGTLAGNATFSSTGSSFTLMGGTYNGTTGVIFSGVFTGPITWTLVNPGCGGSGDGGGGCTYDLSGNLLGTWYPNGPFKNVAGGTIQLFFNSSGPYAGGIIQDSGGFSYAATPLVTPEPGTLLLMATGLVSFEWIGRHKIRPRSVSPAVTTSGRLAWQSPNTPFGGLHARITR